MVRRAMRRRKSGDIQLTDGMPERRSSIRFPIERAVQVRVLGDQNQEVCTGRTINMSSSGILFTTDRQLEPGWPAEVAVSWPVSLDNQCALKLVVRGRIVRTEPGRAAVQFQQYEFRTMGSKTF